MCLYPLFIKNFIGGTNCSFFRVWFPYNFFYGKIDGNSILVRLLSANQHLHRLHTAEKDTHHGVLLVAMFACHSLSHISPVAHSRSHLVQSFFLYKCRSHNQPEFSLYHNDAENNILFLFAIRIQCNCNCTVTVTATVTAPHMRPFNYTLLKHCYTYYTLWDQAMLSPCLVCLATANSPYFPSIFHGLSPPR